MIRTYSRLRQLAWDRTNSLALPAGMHALHLLEREAASSLDRTVLAAAADKASEGRWNREEEYAANVRTECVQSPCVCPLCGEPACHYLMQDLFDPRVRRRQSVCVECGPIVDLPEWPVQATLVPKRPREGGGVLQEVRALKNRDVRRRTVLAVLRASCFPHAAPAAAEVVDVQLAPGAEARVTLGARLQGRPSGFCWIRVYLVCEGGFGFLARPCVF